MKTNFTVSLTLAEAKQTVATVVLDRMGISDANVIITDVASVSRVVLDKPVSSEIQKAWRAGDQLHAICALRDQYDMSNVEEARDYLEYFAYIVYGGPAPIWVVIDGPDTTPPKA